MRTVAIFGLNVLRCHAKIENPGTQARSYKRAATHTRFDLKTGRNASCAWLLYWRRTASEEYIGGRV